MKTTILAAAAVALLLAPATAEARRSPGFHPDCNRLFPCELTSTARASQARVRVARHRERHHHRLEARNAPRAVSGHPRHLRHIAHHGLPWCGIFMGELTGHLARRLWVAREWATEGVNAGGPGVGVIVVWRHHVGRIEGGPDRHGRWLVHSGNDGGRVRTRPRSLAGAIAFRRV